VYRSVPLKEIFDILDELTGEAGWTLSSEYHQTASKGQQHLLRFAYDTHNPLFKFEIVILNSYNKTIALKVAAGVSVTACFNGMICGEFVIDRKHTGSVKEDLSAFFKGFINKKDAAVAEAEEMWKVFNETEINKFDIYCLLGELFMRDCLNTQQLNAVKNEIELNVQYEGCTDKSLNLLYQHVTFAQKNTHPLIYEKVRHTTTLIFNTHYEDFQVF
jgi:Domain of unknown function (DUF932)